MKIAVLFIVVLSGLSCQDKKSVDPADQRIEQMRHKAQEFERQQKQALENDKKAGGSLDKAAEEFRRSAKEARERHTKEDKK